MKPILLMNNISFSYINSGKQINVIDGLSLNIIPGEIIALIGPEQCGKSTLLSIICGLLTPTSGYIQCNNIHVGYMVQTGSLFQWHASYRNLSKQYHNLPTDSIVQKPSDNNIHCCKSQKSCKCCKKKSSLIMTLASEPDLLLLDEPFISLDHPSGTQLRNDIIELVHQEHKSAIIISLNIDDALSLSDRVIILSHCPCHILKDFNVSGIEHTK